MQNFLSLGAVSSLSWFLLIFFIPPLLPRISEQCVLFQFGLVTVVKAWSSLPPPPPQCPFLRVFQLISPFQLMLCSICTQVGGGLKGGRKKLVAPEIYKQALSECFADLLCSASPLILCIRPLLLFHVGVLVKAMEPLEMLEHAQLRPGCPSIPWLPLQDSSLG